MAAPSDKLLDKPCVIGENHLLVGWITPMQATTAYRSLASDDWTMCAHVSRGRNQTFTIADLFLARLPYPSNV